MIYLYLFGTCFHFIYVFMIIGNNHRVIRYPLNGTWIDIGQQADLAKARELVKHLNNK